MGLPLHEVLKMQMLELLLFRKTDPFVAKPSSPRERAIACLMMGRIAVEFVLRPLDEEGAGGGGKG